MCVPIYRRGAPFRRRLDMSIQHLIEAGLMEHWLQQLVQSSKSKDGEPTNEAFSELLKQSSSESVSSMIIF